jgi:hypothetical protein
MGMMGFRVAGTAAALAIAVGLLLSAPTEHTHYSMLGVPPDADLATIKKACVCQPSQRSAPLPPRRLRV